ncbi:hypothetical protein Pta02_01720 [Planobispora takensis]|uniref:Uncharacterized protein n=1 Tax=Planobispora takensis TaxID=1367882 RepID=A0A8J3WQ79_9ACTN|nr:hypothetical protein Pta02_01720 [Planobispora takensis]
MPAASRTVSARSGWDRPDMTIPSPAPAPNTPTATVAVTTVARDGLRDGAVM